MNSNSYVIVVDLELKELEYFLYHEYTKKISAKILIVMAFMVGLLTLVTLISTPELKILQGFVLPAIIFGWMPFAIKRQAKKVFETSNNQFKNNKYEFNEEGVFIESTNGNSNFTWDLLFKIEENKKQFLLFANSSVAHVIPKRCFKNEEEQVAFFKLASQKINSSNK